MNAFMCILAITINWSGAIVFDTIDSPISAWTIDPGLVDANGGAGNGAVTGTDWNRTLPVTSNDTTVSGWRRGFAVAELLYGSASTHQIVTAKPTEPAFDPGMGQGDVLKWLDNIAYTKPSVTVTIDAYKTKKTRKKKYKKKKKRKKKVKKGRNLGVTRHHQRQGGEQTLYPYQAMYGYEPYWANDRPTERQRPRDEYDDSYTPDSDESVTRTTKEPECGDTLNCHRARANYGPVCAKNSVFMKKDFPDLCALEVENHCGAYQWIIAYRGVCRVGLWVQPTWMPHFKWHVYELMSTLDVYLTRWTTIRYPPSPIYMLAMGRLGKTYRYDIKLPP